MKTALEDLGRLRITEETRGEVFKAMKKFEDGAGALNAALQEQSAALEALFMTSAPSREQADMITGKMAALMADMSRLRAEYVADVAEALGPQEARRVRGKGQSPEACAALIEVPWGHCGLSPAEKSAIAVTGDEAQYAADFSKRDTYFLNESRRITGELDRALAGRMIDRSRVEALLKELDGQVLQRVVNRLDQCYYVNQVFFSPDRAPRVQALREKRKAPARHKYWIF
jgi:hypothetical protein